MHPSVMRFLREQIGADEICNKEVLEVGSANVNGSPTEVLMPHRPKRYVGVDSAAGPGVDVILDAADLVRKFGLESFDVVISTEMLEHARNWRASIYQMKQVLRQGGLLVVTARSPGFPIHVFPEDHWRFTEDDFIRIFSDMWILHLGPDTNPGMPGVFLKARKTGATGTVNLEPLDVARVRERR